MAYKNDLFYSQFFFLLTHNDRQKCRSIANEIYFSLRVNAKIGPEHMVIYVFGHKHYLLDFLVLNI